MTVHKVQTPPTFGAVIIGDEILSGKRIDKHFSWLAGVMAERGLRLSWVEYLGDDRARLASVFRRTRAAGDVVFSFGGIGNTPDDHTRQAAAAAFDVPLLLHPDAEREIRARFATEEVTPQRLLLGTFPEGSAIIPNPFNRIPGFMMHRHYFVPGFPQMAHPMLTGVLDTFYSAYFQRAPDVDRAILLTGEGAYESALLDLMERIVASYPDLKLFSLPSLTAEGVRRHLELGVTGEAQRVEQALNEMIAEVDRRALTWTYRPD
ncbi:MAG: competence/damage-inducible protein A [Fluviibacter sp.]